MELILPEQILLNEVSKAILSDVEETSRRVNEYRPLPATVVTRIQDGLLGERVYSSNAIEGSTLDLRETLTVLNTGRILENRRREAIEARNLGEAVRHTSTIAELGKAAHSLERLLEIHRLILRETPDEYWGGRFREQRVIIEGAKYQPPDHTIVPSLVERVMENLAQEGDQIPGLVRACWAHWAIARIHPFKDGNGRIARLWQDLLLFQENLTCAIILPEQRRDYLDALTKSDEGDFNSLIQLVSSRVLKTFDRYLTEIAQEDELDAFATEIAGEADARLAERQKLKFDRWVRRMEQLRWEFEVCAARVTEKSGRVRIQIRKYDTIDQAQWENISAGLSAERTWFFILSFDTRHRRGSYCFFFGKHYPITELDNENDRSENRTCLLISENDGTEHAKRLDQIDRCPISIREIFLADDAFLVRRRDPKTGETSYDRNVAPLRIAQDFIRDVVLHRLT